MMILADCLGDALRIGMILSAIGVGVFAAVAVLLGLVRLLSGKSKDKQQK